MNNITKDGTLGIISKFRELIGNLKRARVGYILISGILCVMWGIYERGNQGFGSIGLTSRAVGSPANRITQDKNTWGLKCVCLNAKCVVKMRNLLVYMVNDTNPDIIGITG